MVSTIVRNTVHSLLLKHRCPLDIIIWAERVEVKNCCKTSRSPSISIGKSHELKLYFKLDAASTIQRQIVEGVERKATPRVIL